MIGKLVSHYKILSKLGAGGMGVVYKAEDTKLDRMVALKFLPEDLHVEAAEKTRFMQEAKAAAALNHPNVCIIYEVQEKGDLPYIVMEYVDGQTMDAVIRANHETPADLEQTLDYAIQIADALSEAHLHDIVHRDIKSENIMVNAKDQIKVMDFGLAKLRGAQKLTKADSTVGTLSYSSPEQIQGKEVDARSDIFSFGVLLFEMFVGHLPFQGDYEAAVVYSILNEEPEPVQRSRPDLPSELLHVLNRALEKDPEERYQSAKDLLIDLRRARKQGSSAFRPVRSSQQPAPEVASELTEESRAQPISKKTGSGRPFLLAAAAVAVLAIVALLWQSFSGPDSPPRPFATMQMSRLTNEGTAGFANISPDGKYITYTTSTGSESKLWIKQILTGSIIEIMTLEEGMGFGGTTFSPDGNYVFFTRFDTEGDEKGALYQVPVLGGASRRILTNIVGSVCIAPDGTKMAFIRRTPSLGEEVLIVANIDGSGQRALARRQGSEFFVVGGVGPSWSPDGEHIAVAAGEAIEDFKSGVLLVSVADGSQTWLSPPNWIGTYRVVWLHDGSGVVVSSLDVTTDPNNQLWFVSYPDGQVSRITNDLANYGDESLGLTADDQTLLTLHEDRLSNIWISPEDGDSPRQITRGAGKLEGYNGLSIAEGGDIVFGSIVSGNQDIWLMDADGLNPVQMTTHPSADNSPAISPDGRTIAWTSDRAGIPHIWLMDSDGANQRQLTSQEDYGPTWTPDGKWIVYSGWGSGHHSIWKVSVAGGEPIPLVAKPSSVPVVSPNGAFLTCFYEDDNEIWKIAVLPMSGGEPIEKFRITSELSPLGWSADGSAILYVDDVNNVSNIWSLRREDGMREQITHFESGLIFDLHVSLAKIPWLWQWVPRPVM